MLLLPPRPTLFPYTTLFRSSRATLWAPEQAACAPITPQNPGSQISQVCGPWRSPLGSRRGRPDERGHVDTDSAATARSEEHTSELQSHSDLVCRLLLEKKNY